MNPPTYSSIVRINHPAKRVWEVLSGDRPETWIPFLDSRRLASDERSRDDRIYYPSGQAVDIVAGTITYIPTGIHPETLAVEFQLHFDPLTISTTVTLHDIERACLAEVVVDGKGTTPDLKKTLEIICKGLANNLNNVCDLLYPRPDSDGIQPSAGASLPAMAARHPNMTAHGIEEVALSDLSDFRQIMAQGRPVVISGYGSTLEHSSSLTDWQWWGKVFDDSTVTVRIFPAAHTYTRDAIMQTTFSRFRSALESNPNQRFAAYEIPAEYFLGLRQYAPTPSFIPRQCPVFCENIWMGSARVRAPLHQDGRLLDLVGRAPFAFHNLNFQVAGTKRWIVAHPSQSKYLYPYPPGKSTYPRSEIDFLAPVDFDRYPLAANAEIYEAILHPGQVLYIPRGWWHQAQALEQFININYFFGSHEY